MSEMLRLMSVDRNKLRLDLEDMRAERNNYLDLLTRETATKAGLARELEVAIQEVDHLRDELDEARTRIQELEEQ